MNSTENNFLRGGDLEDDEETESSCSTTTASSPRSLSNTQTRAKSSCSEDIWKDDAQTLCGRWSKQEDDLLRKAVSAIGPRNWKRIATEYLHDQRSDVQCLHRWQKVLRPGLVKGPWTALEDETILSCMEEGITRWSEIAKRVPGRIGKQCRERWFNHLDPSIRRTEWSPEEDQLLIKGQKALGNKWSQIAKVYLPGRPENAVKNRWNAATRRRRVNKGSENSSTGLKSKAVSDPEKKSLNFKRVARGATNSRQVKMRREKPLRSGTQGSIEEARSPSEMVAASALVGHAAMSAIPGVCPGFSSVITPPHIDRAMKESRLTPNSRKMRRGVKHSPSDTATVNSNSGELFPSVASLPGVAYGKPLDASLGQRSLNAYDGTAALLAAVDKVEGTHRTKIENIVSERSTMSSEMPGPSGCNVEKYSAFNGDKKPLSSANVVKDSKASTHISVKGAEKASLEENEPKENTSATKADFGPASALLFLSRQEVKAAI